MNIKNILITESEKRNIKKMYGLISEEDIKPVRIRHKDNSKYDVNSTDPKKFIDKFVTDLVAKIDGIPEGKKMRSSGKMTIQNLTTQTGASNHWAGKTTGYDYENNLTTPAKSKIETELYDKNKDLSKRRAEVFNKLLQTKLTQFGIKFSPQTKITNSSDVINTGGKNDEQKDSSKYPNNGQYVGLNLVLQYADKMTPPTEPAPPTSMIPRIQCLKGMKIELNYDAVVEKSVDGGGLSNVHCCSRGEFAITANNIRLSRSDKKSVNANINNHPDEITRQNPQTDGRRQGQSSTGLKKTVKFPNGEGVCLPPNLKKGTVVDTNFKLEGLDNYRYNTFIIDAAMAEKIVKDSNGQSGVLNIGVSAVDSDTHSSAARLLVYSPEGKLYWDSCSGGVCQRKAVYPVPFCSGK